MKFCNQNISQKHALSVPVHNRRQIRKKSKNVVRKKGGKAEKNKNKIKKIWKSRAYEEKWRREKITKISDNVKQVWKNRLTTGEKNITKQFFVQKTLKKWSEEGRENKKISE